MAMPQGLLPSQLDKGPEVLSAFLSGSVASFLPLGIVPSLTVVFAIQTLRVPLHGEDSLIARVLVLVDIPGSLLGKLSHGCLRCSGCPMCLERLVLDMFFTKAGDLICLLVRTHSTTTRKRNLQYLGAVSTRFVFSSGFFPFFPGILCNVVRKSPQNMEKKTRFPGGEKIVESCHACGCHGLFGPDLGAFFDIRESSAEALKCSCSLRDTYHKIRNRDLGLLKEQQQGPPSKLRPAPQKSVNCLHLSTVYRGLFRADRYQFLHTTQPRGRAEVAPKRPFLAQLASFGPRPRLLSPHLDFAC